MRPFLEKLKAIVKHPVTQLITGVILLVSGGSEVIYDLFEAEKKFRLGAHHGVAAFGLIQVLGSIPDIFDGLGRYFDSHERRHQR